MTTAALVGSTGLVGSHILSTLLAHPSISSVHAYARRALPTESSKLEPIISTDNTTWPSSFPSSPAPSIFFSALGTTRGAAGSVQAQRRIDLDLNLDLAKAAHAAGVKTYVLISSTSASAKSSFAYPKMKGELEDAVQALGFDHCIILRPGLIVGDRSDNRLGEAIFRSLAKGMARVSTALTDFWAQDKDIIAKAAVSAGLQCLEGKHEKGTWIMGQSDIVRLGRTEWKEAESK